MAGQPLAKVAHPEALDAAEGARAKLAIVVPAGWLDDRLEIELTAPKLLACDRCDGGGCDGCERSGALRAPVDAEARRLRLVVQDAGGGKVRVRLAQPFGPGVIEQLIVQVTAGAEASPCVRRIPNPPTLALATPVPLASGVALVVAAIVAIAVALALALGR